MPAVYEGLGVEQLIDLVDLSLREKYADALAYQQAKGDVYDQERWLAVGNDIDDWQSLVLDEVPASNFHAGALPSFVQVDDRDEFYPLVATVPGRIAPDPEDVLMDQMGVVQSFISIHVFAKADDPLLSFRKATRMAEAVYQVVTSPPLRGKVNRKAPDNVVFSEPWKYYKNGADHGVEGWWFAIGTDYRIKNYIRQPEGV